MKYNIITNVRIILIIVITFEHERLQYNELIP